jgi:uncharacterized DUF497 family protein
MGTDERITRAAGFHWDQGNLEKNWLAHKVSPAECEQIFFNRPLVVAADFVHSEAEERFFTLGQTDRGRLLFIAFTLRNDLIRVISARDMSRKNERSMSAMVEKQLPEFESEAEEQAFWTEHDSAGYIDWSKARRTVLPNLRPSTKTISLRLPEHMLEELKLLANKQDVPYQSLLKMFLAERIELELRGSRRKAS